MEAIVLEIVSYMNYVQKGAWVVLNRGIQPFSFSTFFFNLFSTFFQHFFSTIFQPFKFNLFPSLYYFNILKKRHQNNERIIIKFVLLKINKKLL